MKTDRPEARRGGCAAARLRQEGKCDTMRVSPSFNVERRAASGSSSRPRSESSNAGSRTRPRAVSARVHARRKVCLRDFLRSPANGFSVHAVGNTRLEVKRLRSGQIGGDRYSYPPLCSRCDRGEIAASISAADLGSGAEPPRFEIDNTRSRARANGERSKVPVSGIPISREISRGASPRLIPDDESDLCPMTSHTCLDVAPAFRWPMNGERTFSVTLHTADCICCAAAAAADDSHTRSHCFAREYNRHHMRSLPLGPTVRACGTYKDGQVSAFVRLPVNGIAEVIADLSRRTEE